MLAAGYDFSCVQCTHPGVNLCAAPGPLPPYGTRDWVHVMICGDLDPITGKTPWKAEIIKGDSGRNYTGHLHDKK